MMNQEIEQCEETSLQAFREKDSNVLDKLINDRLIFNIPTGEIISKEMDLQTYRADDTVIETIDCLERKIQIFGNTAIVSTLVYLKGSFMGDNKIEGKNLTINGK